MKNEKGQTLLEFILLLFVLIGIAVFMMKTFNSGIAQRWKDMVILVARPSNSPIDFR